MTSKTPPSPIYFHGSPSPKFAPVYLCYTFTISRCPTKMYILLQTLQLLTVPLYLSAMSMAGVLEEYLLRVEGVVTKLLVPAILFFQKLTLFVGILWKVQYSYPLTNLPSPNLNGVLQIHLYHYQSIAMLCSFSMSYDLDTWKQF